MSNMKAEIQVSKQDIRTKAFQKGQITRAYLQACTSSFTQSLNIHLLGINYGEDTA